MNHATLSIKSTGCHKAGSVIVIAVLTLAILSLIAAGTLSVVSSKYNATFQASSWQESLQGAEAGVDIAMDALNRNSWTGWYQVNSSPPPRSAPLGPSPAPSASPPPNGQYYFYQPPDLTHVGEGNNRIKIFVTVDTAGMSPGLAGQWYRIRSTGITDISGAPRASSEKLDNSLRKLSLFTDRITGASTGNKGHAQRTIEVIAQALPQSIWARGITLKGAITMSTSGTIDSFDSNSPFKSNNGLYDPSLVASARLLGESWPNHGDIATTNSGTTSNLGYTYVYGNLAYSGSTVKNATNVEGNISTPFYATIPPTTDPASYGSGGYTWTNPNPQGGQTYIWPTYTPYTGAPATNIFTVTGSQSSPSLIKITGDFNLGGSTTFNIVNGNAPPQPGGTPPPAYVNIWVTGQFNTGGTSKVVQAGNVYVTWIVDKDITVSGSSYSNQSGLAANTSFIGVGTSNKVNESGTSSFIGTINAPGYDVTVSGSGSFVGALIGKTINISGSASFHYDTALNNGANSDIGNYAFASWFEDTR